MILNVQLFLALLYPFVHAGLKDLCGLNCPTTPRVKRNFYIYWNVPTFMCHKYGLKFKEVKKFHILQNTNDTFRGNVISLLYDPGEFPAMIPSESSSKKGQYTKRNGGVPQMGNFDKHRYAFIKDLGTNIPDLGFSGIGVIDFEKWRPIFRQNWGNTKIHKDVSIDLVKQIHPNWIPALIESEAMSKFEKYARRYMEETLKLAKKFRFMADWGYYGYPQCFNLSPGHPGPDCDPKVMSDNDKMSWLFNNQEVLMPSVYLRYFLKPDQRVGLVKGRVREAVRISNNLKHKPRVIPYWWYKYSDQVGVYVSETDVQNTFKEILANGGDGIIIWGSSSDVNTESKCKSLKKYVKAILGPIAENLLKVANSAEVFNVHYNR